MRSLSYITCLIFLFVGLTVAQTELQKSVVSNGGGKTAAENKVIHASIGQPVVGNTANSEIKARIGFWHHSVEVIQEDIYAVFREESSNPSLSQNYPNPFNDRTTFDLFLPFKEKIVMTIFHIDGRFVRTLINGSLDPGTYKVSLMASELLPGQFYCEFKAGDYLITRKLIVVK